MVIIPKHLQAVTPEESARLLEKQWKARVWVRTNPQAYGMSLKWKKFFQRSARPMMLKNQA